MKKSIIHLIAVIFLSGFALRSAEEVSGHAKGAFQSNGGFSFRLKTDQGWPILERPFYAVPLASYRGWYYHCYSLELDSGNAPKVQLADKAWDYRRFNYNLSGGKKASIVLSRLTPAVLIETQNNYLKLAKPANFKLKPPRFSFLPRLKVKTGAAKYAAWTEGGKIVVKATSSLNGKINLSEPWILLWFGKNSPLRGNDSPQADPGGGPFAGSTGDKIYRRLSQLIDMPLLVRLEKNPSSISFNDGVILKFSDSAGKVAVMPLFGGKFLSVEETEKWNSSLPAVVIKQCRQWSTALRDYPLTVKESFSFDGKDTLTITEDFKWDAFKDDWKSKAVKAAPLPPLVGLAISGKAPVTFTAGGKNVNPTGMNLMDTPGKAVVIMGTDSYNMVIKGLGKYIFMKPASGPVPSEAKKFQSKLEKHVREMVEKGRLKPLIFSYAGVASHINMGIYFANPAECADAIRAAYPYLSPELQKKAVTYVQNELKENPPFKTKGYNKGANRAPYELPNEGTVGVAIRRDSELRQSNFFRDILPLVKYAEVTGDKSVPPETMKKVGMKKIQEILAKQDWALMGPNIGKLKDTPKYFNLNGEASYNSWLAGAMGFTRLSRQEGWKKEEALGYYMTAKLALARLGLANYVNQMYAMGLMKGDPKKDWRCVSHIDTNCVVIVRGNFDMRIRSDQEIPKFYNLTPETARFLADYGKADSQRYLDMLDYSAPYFWMSEAVKQGATEHRQSPLNWKHEAVLAEYWILGKKGEKFRKYIDTTRFKGDYYYIQNLAALIDSYKSK